MATRKPRRFGEGGSSDKEEGLKASKDEKVGFLERLRMGNIDQEGSEAYKRFGAGRGRKNFENTPAKEPAQYRSDPYGDMTQAERDARRSSEDYQAKKRGVEQGKRQPSGDAAVAEDYQGPRKEPVSSAPAKATPKAEAKPMPKAEVKAAPKTAPKADTSNYSNEGRGSKPVTSAASPKGSSDSKKSLVDQIPRDKATPVSGEKVDSTELGRNISNALNATPGIQAVGRIAGAGKAAQKAAGSRALSTAVDDGVTFLGKSGRRQVGGFDELGAAAKKLADGRKAAITREGGPALANSPTKRLTGPSKGELTARDRAARAKKRQDEMTKENADRYGLDPKSPDYADKAKAVRDNLGGSDFSLGMKKGGSVKGWGMARGARKAKIV